MSRIKFYNTTSGQWEPVTGTSIGPTGAQGATGPAGRSITIKGTLPNVASLPATGNTAGDGYIINGSLYVWDGTEWNNVGTIQGPTGPSGPAGATGPTGYTGATGVAGPTGAQGDSGYTGPTGPQGSQGYTGAMGATGAQGPQGIVGPQGYTGPAGTSVTILGTLEDPADLPSTGNSPGDGYLINGELWVWSGTDWTDVGNIQGPTGPAGTVGIDGSTGPTGASGPAIFVGPDAPSGPSGAMLWFDTDDTDAIVLPAGATGPTGPTGGQGYTGSQGPTGPAGTNGTNGFTGPTGPQGSTGPTGNTGAQGATGPSGPTYATYTANNFVAGTSQAIANNIRYIANNAAIVTFTLPATAAAGSLTQIVGMGAGGWQIAQNSGQSVKFGNQTTSTGSAGYLASTNQFDVIELLCITANTTWTVINSQGNITYV